MHFVHRRGFFLFNFFASFFIFFFSLLFAVIITIYIILFHFYRSFVHIRFIHMHSNRAILLLSVYSWLWQFISFHSVYFAKFCSHYFWFFSFSFLSIQNLFHASFDYSYLYFVFVFFIFCARLGWVSINILFIWLFSILLEIVFEIWIFKYNSI